MGKKLEEKTFNSSTQFIDSFERISKGISYGFYTALCGAAACILAELGVAFEGMDFSPKVSQSCIISAIGLGAVCGL